MSLLKLAIKLLISENNPAFIRKALTFSSLIFIISFTSLTFINSVTNGFRNSLKNKLSDIDGHIRINHLYNEFTHSDSLSPIISLLLSNSNVINFSQYTQKHSMIRSELNKSEGILLYGIEKNIKEILNIKKYLIKDLLSGLDDGEIIIGMNLAKHLNVSLGDSLYLFNLDNVLDSSLLYAKKVKISNIFETNIEEYDKNIVFTNLFTFNSLYYLGESVSGLIISIEDPDELKITDDELYNDIIGYNHITTTWMERHSSIISWLEVYNKPIGILITLITLIAIINIVFCSWIFLSTKSREISLLRSLGYSKINIRFICIFQVLILTSLSILIANFLTLFLIYTQTSLKFIKLNPQIYFTDFLPVEYNFYFLLIMSFIFFFISSVLSLLPVLNISKINLAKSINNEQYEYI